MIRILLAIVFVNGAVCGLIGRREAVTPRFQLQCSHINQVILQFDMESGATRQILSDAGNIVINQAPSSAWEEAHETINYKKYWDVNDDLIALLGISVEEESILRLNKLIEFTTRVSQRLDARGCPGMQQYSIGLLSALVQSTTDLHESISLKTWVQSLLHDRANSLFDRHAKKQARKLVRAYNRTETPATFSCLAYRIQAKEVLKLDIC